MRNPGKSDHFILILTSSLRMLLHKAATQSGSPVQKIHNVNTEESVIARNLITQVLDRSIERIDVEESKPAKSIRWELGACWVQHLQNKDSGKDSKKTEEAKVEPAVKGLGKHGGLLKDLKKKPDNKADPSKEPAANGLSEANKKETVKLDEEKEIMLRKLLTEASYLRLKESETGLHLKVCSMLL